MSSFLNDFNRLSPKMPSYYFHKCVKNNLENKLTDEFCKIVFYVCTAILLCDIYADMFRFSRHQTIQLTKMTIFWIILVEMYMKILQLLL